MAFTNKTPLRGHKFQKISMNRRSRAAVGLFWRLPCFEQHTLFSVDQTTGCGNWRQLRPMLPYESFYLPAGATSSVYVVNALAEADRVVLLP